MDIRPLDIVLNLSTLEDETAKLVVFRLFEIEVFLCSLIDLWHNLFDELLCFSKSLFLDCKIDAIHQQLCRLTGIDTLLVVVLDAVEQYFSVVVVALLVSYLRFHQKSLCLFL